eukprot:COSAG02_NODE_2530_length_8601_cov_17.564455_6_plen_41_part_01
MRARGGAAAGCSTEKRRSYPFMHDQYVVQYANSPMNSTQNS